MSDHCNYYALRQESFLPLLEAPDSLAGLQDFLDQCLVATWQCPSTDAGEAGLGQALHMLSHNAERFAPLDVTPAELHRAWGLLSDTLNVHADRLAWCSKFRRAGLTSPEELASLITQLHTTKCLELLLPTPISGPTKANILSLCRFLEAHDNGREWILAIETPE